MPVIPAIQKCAIIIFLLIPQMVWANEILVKYKITDSASVEEMIHGQMQVEVQNLTNHELQNVDLRVDSPPSVLLEKGILQLGSIPAGEQGVAMGQFDLPASALASGEPFFWRVDYDTAGAHSQTIVPGIR